MLYLEREAGEGQREEARDHLHALRVERGLLQDVLCMVWCGWWEEVGVKSWRGVEQNVKHKHGTDARHTHTTYILSNLRTHSLTSSERLAITAAHCPRQWLT